MKTIDFEKELKALNPDLAIIPNPNNPGLSNIKLNGRDICPVPADEIKDEPDPFYNFTFSNGMMARHKSKNEALAQVNHVLNLVKTKEGRDLFFS
jgi:hypothetical protein